ncbi:hypothetical protein Leryth_026822 [Lithospermum erythrorhizon]|nr:hypothetical protein Leryth_026822 [Lithospermum erythrorhizon]
MDSSQTTKQDLESNTSMTLSAEEVSAKAVQKRFDSLVMVRTKAVKGKGAWYWHHLEPTLIHNNPDNNNNNNNNNICSPKAVKLRCVLCDAVFSASNPSRTASEHLKRGTCPNFNNSVIKPISAVPVSSPSGVSLSQNVVLQANSIQENVKNHRKRSNSSSTGSRGTKSSTSGGLSGSIVVYNQAEVVTPVAIVDPSRFSVEMGCNAGVVPHGTPVEAHGTSVVAGSSTSTEGGGGGMYGQQHHVMLSGGKEDLGALAMLEDSVKKLKSPKAWVGPTLSKAQMEAALDYLADWVYECCGSVSFSSLEHPKFKSFLNQVGMPNVSIRELVGAKLDAKYEEVKVVSEAKIRDAMFFQVVADGWKVRNHGHIGEEGLVNLAVNLPNGTSVFRRAVFTSGYVPSKYAEDVLWNTIIDICGNSIHQCVGIVSDKFKNKALKNLENRHHRMINLYCQYQGFNGLIKDFSRDLPSFINVSKNCSKLVNFINNKSAVRHSFHRYQLQEYGHAGLLRVCYSDYQRLDFGAFYNMLEDILSSVRALELLLLDESFKILLMKEPLAGEIEEMMRNPHFWHELRAVHSLVKLVKGMAKEIEIEKPRIGQCLPLWEELRGKVREWCSEFHIVESTVERVIDRRFNKNYHPAWAAAFILDPLYLTRDTSGKYLPPFKYLTPEQEKDVSKLITTLVSREEAPIVLMELMKWRTEGLDPIYAQAVQLKQRDPSTGKMRIANPQSSRLVWETYLTDFKSLGKLAVRLIFLQATSCGLKCNLSLLKWATAQSHSGASMDKAQKLLFVAAHSKLQKRDHNNDEEKDSEQFAFANGEDDMLNDVLIDTSSA